MTFTDQMGNTIHLKAFPQRIVSIVPSQSEYLWDIGIREELVGISKFCVHPGNMFRSVERVGGTKELDLSKIRALKPDLILGNKEENEQRQIETLRREFNVWMSDIYNLEDAFAMMRSLGQLLNREKEAVSLVDQASGQLSQVKNLFNGQRVAYFIWNKPYMLAGQRTFISQVMEYAGFRNAVADRERYPEFGPAQLKELNPDHCFLSSEPFPFREKHAGEIKNLLPLSGVHLVDGEMFSWYGSRLLKLPAYLRSLKNKLL